MYFVFLTVSSCTDSSIGDCFVRTGDRTTVTYELAPFHQLEVVDGLDVYLSEGTDYRVTVEAGGHIINHIKVEQQDGMLKLSDDISCEWARKYAPKVVRVQAPHLRAIHQHGFGNVVAEDTLHYDSLELRLRYGSGNIDLVLDNHYVAVESHRNGDITLTGNTRYLQVGLLYYMPIFDARQLRAHHVMINHHCNNDMHLYPIRRLTGQMDTKGNVYLYHMPQELRVNVLGTGQIIDVSGH